MSRTLVQVTKFKEAWVVTESTDNSSGYNDTSTVLKQFETKSEADAYYQKICSFAKKAKIYTGYNVEQKWIFVSQTQHYE
jgi:hypothetical protein